MVAVLSDSDVEGPRGELRVLRTRGLHEPGFARARELVAPGPAMDRPIAPRGYLWFYLDAVSDDGAAAVVIIAMLGNPFSPGYARARSGGAAADALAFSAMNVGVYARGASAWSLTEQAVSRGDRSARDLRIGASRIGWEGDALVVRLDERTAPFARPLRGRVVLRPHAVSSASLALDPRGAHRWWPVAPRADVEVELDAPRLRFRGKGYHDANAGEGPLDEAFDAWTWSRGHLTGGRTAITYDVRPRGAAPASHSLLVGPDGAVGEGPRLAWSSLGLSRWGIRQGAMGDAGAAPRLTRALEDTPFYARSEVATRIDGERVACVHETLSLERFRARWVQGLLGFRMRRV